MSRLQARRLCVSLTGRDILKGIDLSFIAGSFVGLIGPNGAGKSTLMRVLAGLLPASGEVSIGGRALDSLTAKERAREIAYLPQNRDIAWPIAVEAVVALARLPHRPAFTGPSGHDRKVIDRSIAEMELERFRQRRASELSGGELARVLMARVLAQETDIIIADEPTAGLDPAHQLSLMQIFQRLAGSGRIVIASLHELSLAARWCDRLVLLDGGQIIADGRPEDVLTPDQLKSVYGIDAFIGRDAGGLLLVPTNLSESRADAKRLTPQT